MARRPPPINILLSATSLQPATFGKSPLPTLEGNILVEVMTPGNLGGPTFLVGMRTDGWYICLPEPLNDDRQTEEYVYHWLGPKATRQEAIALVPEAMESYIESTRERLEELEDTLEWVRTHTRRWGSPKKVPVHRLPPKLRVVGAES